MTDLRIRIATAIMQSCHGVYMVGLRQESSEYDGFFGRRTRHRYVTEWTSDE